MADNNGEVRGLALELLFEDDEVETKLDEEFNGEIEEAMNEVRFYMFFYNLLTLHISYQLEF